MVDLVDIPNITSQELELLEAIGFQKREALKAADAFVVVAEMEHANEMLHLTDRAPSLEEVEGWIAYCREDVAPNSIDSNLKEAASEAVSEGKVAPEQAQREEDDIELMLAEAPIAIPLPSKALTLAKINVRNVAEGTMLSACDASIEVKVTSDQAQNQEMGEKGKVPLKKTPLHTPTRKVAPEQREESAQGVDKTRVRTMEKFMEEGGNVAPLTVNKPNVSKMVLAETNKGVSRESRRYIRGVLHNQKERAYIGSVAFLVVWVTCWLPFIGLALFFLDTEGMWWAKYSPAIWILSAFIYFAFALKVNCPVCRQRQFFPKACVKHRNAHKISGLGLMLPTAMHIFLFKWARCIFCGTSLRYKE